MRPFTAILVRPSTSTYLMRPAYSAGRYLVKASVVSYMWLSASKTRKSNVRGDMAVAFLWFAASAGSVQPETGDGAVIYLQDLNGTCCAMLPAGQGQRKCHF